MSKNLFKFCDTNQRLSGKSCRQAIGPSGTIEKGLSGAGRTRTRVRGRGRRTSLGEAELVALNFKNASDVKKATVWNLFYEGQAFHILFTSRGLILEVSTQPFNSLLNSATPINGLIISFPSSSPTSTSSPYKSCWFDCSLDFSRNRSIDSINS